MNISDSTVAGFCAAVSYGLMPIVIAKGFVDATWKDSLPERKGEGDWNKIPTSLAKQNVWFHAASMGEVVGLVPIIQALDELKLASSRVITTTSLTGKNDVKKRGLVEQPCLLPLDHPRCIERAIKKVQPRLVVITETELWPNFLFAMKEAQVPVVLVNARISDLSYPKYSKLKALTRPMLRCLTFILAQTEVDKERFIELGARQECVEVAGCTKFDRPRAEFSDSQLHQLISGMGLDPQKPIFVMGSVRSEEDVQVIQAYAEIRKEYPELQTIVAPRHPDNYDSVEGMLKGLGLDVHRRSFGEAGKIVDAVLLDTMGELAKVYAAGSFAFVGGSLVPIGGHNPLEPAAYAKPVLMGPYSSNVRDVASDLKLCGAMVEVANKDELVAALEQLLTDTEDRFKRGQSAYEVWQKHQGATRRVVERIVPYL